MNKRKVIQIASQIDSVGKYLVLAVCNDGTLWKLDGLYEGKSTWEPFPNVPQPPPEELPKAIRKLPSGPISRRQMMEEEDDEG